MATLTLTVGSISQTSATITWSIRGMDEEAVSAGLCKNKVTSETDDPGVITDNKASGGAASGDFTAYKSEYPTGRFGAYGFGASADGKYYSAGGGYKSIAWEWPPPPVPRPTNWRRQSLVAEDRPIRLTASEWDAFCSRINAFRAYAYQDASGGHDWPGFKPVHPGTPISADIVNEAHMAINAVSAGKQPGWRSQGDPITAAYFNGLKDYLNSAT